MTADLKRTDADWEHFAQNDPYWAVSTDERFRLANLGDENRESFFASGEHDIATTFDTIRTHLDPAFAPRRALDFGCGVGRLLLPLATRCEEVVGVDVADSMLREAAANCRAAGANGVELVKGDDELSGVRGSFDLVYSFIVFQHVPVLRGVRIFRRLVELVAPGGCGAIHVTYRVPPPPAAPPAPKRTQLGLLGRAALRPLRRRLFPRPMPPAPPAMQMNPYPLNELFTVIQEARARKAFVSFVDHDGHYGVQLFFQKGS